MKQAYPIILTPSEHGYVVYVPDLDINTEGKDPADAIDMAADAIGLWGISAQALAAKFRRPLRRFPSVRRLRRRPMPWWTLMLTTAIPYDCPAAPASAGAALFHGVRFGRWLRGLQLQEGPPVFPVVGQRRAADGGAPLVIGVQDQGVHAQVVLGRLGVSASGSEMSAPARYATAERYRVLSRSSSPSSSTSIRQ